MKEVEEAQASPEDIKPRRKFAASFKREAVALWLDSAVESAPSSSAHILLKASQ